MRYSEHLKYFIGKPCTIFTVPINRNFKEENPNTFPEPVYNYFLGLIMDIDSQGVLVRQALSPEPLMSYFALEHVVAITEELALDPESEEATALKEHMKITQEQVQEDVKETSVLNIDDLTKISDDMKQTYNS